jgi:uncharacterized membrane protein YgcG
MEANGNRSAPSITTKENLYMSRVFAAILLIAVLVIGGGIIASTAYQAGLSTTITTATASGAPVAPVVVPPYGYGYGYGYGWHPFGFGFGIFGFLATLFFLFIIFALIRAIFWRGGHGRRGGWGSGGWGRPGGYGHGPGNSPWEARAHETFDDWHRRAHGDAPDAGQGDQATPTGTA